MNTSMRTATWRRALCLGVLVALAGTARAADVTLQLRAKAGATSLPGGVSVPVWSYCQVTGTATDCAAPTLPLGPTLFVNQGDVVTVDFTNDLPEASGLLFQGQGMVPDTVGAAASGGTRSYLFTAAAPGTFLYEAALLPNAPHQVAMGLVGALVVRPAAAGQSYADPATAFDDEAVLVLSELDPALNGRADPGGFDMRGYAPRYFLINGKAFPATDPIASGPGRRVLLRYVNGGVQHHSIAVLGLRQNFVAKDASPSPTLSLDVVAESLAPGQTGDAIATVPAGAATGSRFAVHDGSLMLHNAGAPGFGGMLTFVTVGAGTTPVAGPVVTALSLSADQATLTATIAAGAGHTVAAAEAWVDNGARTPIPGSYGAPQVTVTQAVPPHPTGSHAVFVRGQDETGTWGAPRTVTFLVDTTGPAVRSLALAPNPSNGTVAVSLTATGDDGAACGVPPAGCGGSSVVAAEYFLGATGASGTGTPMAVAVSAPVASLSATLAPPVTGGTISVHAQDAVGNWGAFATAALQVVTVGPLVSGLSVSPTPNNGARAYSANQPVVKVVATATSAGATIAGAEGFIDTAGAAGTGFPFSPADGLFDGASEAMWVDIPLATVATLPEGSHPVHVRGRDSAGNWGPVVTAALVVDRTPPTVAGLTLSPNPTFSASSVTLTVNGAADPASPGGASGIASAEYWVDVATPTPGTGTPFTVPSATLPVGTLSTGNHQVSVRIRDVAGNVSATSSATLAVVPDAIFANGFETPFPPWGWTGRSTTSTVRLNRATAAAMGTTGSWGLQALGNNTNYVQYNFGSAANPAWPTCDARFRFRPNGNTSAGKDVFAAASGTGFGAQTLFRVRYRLDASGPQAQIQVGTGNANGAWTNLLPGASPNVLEVVWQAVGSGGPNPGTLRLYVNGVLAQTLGTASGASVTAVRLGSITTAGSATPMHFDTFSSKRSVTTLIGP